MLRRGISLAEVAVSLVLIAIVGAYFASNMLTSNNVTKGQELAAHMKIVSGSAAAVITEHKDHISGILESRPIGAVISYQLNSTTGLITDAWNAKIPSNITRTGKNDETFHLVLKKKNATNDFEAMIITRPGGYVESETMLNGFVAEMGAAAGYSSDGLQISGASGIWNAASADWGDVALVGSFASYLEFQRSPQISAASGDNLPVGTIVMYSGAVPPENWAFAFGQPLDRSGHSDLYTIIGTTYGNGDGTLTFNIPDFRGRTPIGAGTGAGLTSRIAGELIGSETHRLSADEMPTHTHTVTGNTNAAGSHAHGYLQGRHWVRVYTSGSQTSGYLDGNGEGPINRETTWSGSHSHTINISANNAGGSADHNNMQPSIGMNFIIKIK